MSTNYLAAVFFIPHKEENTSLEALLKKARAFNIEKELNNLSLTKKWLYCQWGGFTDCRAYIEKLDSYLLLIIWFSQSQFFKKIPVKNSELSLEKDPNLKLAITFRDACEEILPEVAYVITHLDRAELDKIIKIKNKIEEFDADFIADEGGLTYLSELIAELLTPLPPEYERDSLPVKKGKLVFSSRGNSRWF